MDKFVECLNIVDMIIEEGGCGTIRVYLASVMRDYPETYESVLESRIRGKKVKDIL